MLHEAWLLKRSLSEKVANPTVDHIYQIAMDNGALGGKLLGAGSSGFMVFYIPPEKQPQVIEALFGYLQVPFEFESEGSVLIHYDPGEMPG